MTTPTATAAQTIQALQSELEKSTLEAYSTREKLTAVEERVKSLRQAIAGVQLGQRAATEAVPAAQGPQPIQFEDDPSAEALC